MGSKAKFKERFLVFGCATLMDELAPQKVRKGFPTLTGKLFEKLWPLQEQSEDAGIPVNHSGNPSIAADDITKMRTGIKQVSCALVTPFT